MIKISGQFISEIDLSELEEAMVSSVDRLVGQIASGALDEWSRQAQNTLSTGRDSYVKGLQDRETFKQTGRREYEIALVGFLPNALESGMSPTDLKPGLLAGKSSKTSSQGYRYATVPFRHFASATSKERQPKKAYAKELKDIVQKTGLNKVGRGIAGRPLVGRVKTVTGTEGVVKKLKPYHATTPLEGLTRYQHVYDSGKAQGQLMTFRRVSESPAAKLAASRRGISWAKTWYHPGLKGVRLLPKVAEWTEEELQQGVSKILEG